MPSWYRYYSTVAGMIWYDGPEWTELDWTGPNSEQDRTGSSRNARTVPQYNRIPVNVLCAHANVVTHKRENEYEESCD